MTTKGELIVFLRNKRKISQKELAKRSGVSVQCLSEIEEKNRSVSLKTLDIIVSNLNMTLPDFVCNCLDGYDPATVLKVIEFLR